MTLNKKSPLLVRGKIPFMGGLAPFCAVTMLCLCNALFSCGSQGAQHARNPNALSLDSLHIRKNIYSSGSRNLDTQTQIHFGEEPWFLVASCYVNNPTKDKLFLKTPSMNAIDCVDKLLYPRNGNYCLRHASCFRGHSLSPKLDTFLPGEKHLYFIPFWASPDAKRGDEFYADLSIEGKVIGREAHTKGMYGPCDSIFHFVIHLNIRTNEIRSVDSTFEEIIKGYQAKKGREVICVD